MLTTELLGAERARALLPDLIDILRDSVDGGASVGFLPPLAEDEARAYWREAIDDMARGDRLLLVARLGESVIGTAQLALVSKPNGRHRAEVQKLLVYSRARRQGAAAALMAAVERAARSTGRTLLVLDTRQGDPSERLYAKCGFRLAGVIPQYALNESGGADPSAFYYKLL